jgi:hypothetical protein
MGPGRSHPPMHRFGRAAVSPISTVAFVNFIPIYFELIQLNLKSSKIHRNLNKFRKNKKSHLLVEFKGFPRDHTYVMMSDFPKQGVY